MPVSFRCSCGAKLSASDDHAGKTIACPKCKARLKVPSMRPATAEETADRGFKSHGIPRVQQHPTASDYNDADSWGAPAATYRVRTFGIKALLVTALLGAFVGGTTAGVAGFLIGLMVQGRPDLGPAAESAPPAKVTGKPIVISSDWDFCRVGQVVTLTGKGSINLSDQINVDVELSGITDAVGAVHKVFVRTDTFAKSVASFTEGQTIAVTGTVVKKSDLGIGIGTLLLENCTFHKP
jgi:hypothetical protein